MPSQNNYDPSGTHTSPYSYVPNEIIYPFKGLNCMILLTGEVDCVVMGVLFGEQNSLIKQNTGKMNNIHKDTKHNYAAITQHIRALLWFEKD
mgnify:CR=1 FL=1